MVNNVGISPDQKGSVVSGRKGQPLSITGPRAELARRLRALRAGRGMTLRELAARSGYSLATLSNAESGRRVPSWEVLAAFVQSCGHDPAQWRQLWEVARSSDSGPAPGAGPATDPGRSPASLQSPHDEPTRGPTDVSADVAADVPSRPALPVSGRLWVPSRRRRGVIISATAALISVTVIVLLKVLPGNDRGGSGGTPATNLTSQQAAALLPHPVRSMGTVSMVRGQYLDLDTLRPGWNKGFAPDVGAHDLSFSATAYTLVSMNSASVVVLTGTRQGYADCLNGAYGEQLTADAVKPGVGMCLTTKGGRRALVSVTGVRMDTANQPDRVTVHITVWEIVTDRFDPAPPAHPIYDAYACVGGNLDRSVTIRPSGDPRLQGWQSSRPTPWGTSACEDQVWWAPYASNGMSRTVQFSWIFTLPFSGPATCTLWADYPPPPSGHSGGTAHYSINDGGSLSAPQLAYLAVRQADFRGTWHGLGTYTFTAGQICVTLDNSGTYLAMERGVLAGPVRAACD